MLFATVRNRKIHVKKPDTVIQNGVNVDYLELDMDDEWAEMESIVCVFVNRYTEEQATSEEITNEDGTTDTVEKKELVEQEVRKEMLHTFGKKTMVPWEVLVHSGMLSVSCTGYVGSTKIMTTMYPDSFWTVEQNGPKSGDETIEPTASLYDQIIAAAGSANAAAIAANQAREQLQQEADGLLKAAAQSAAEAEAAAKRAETAESRQPYPDPETGTWWVWDATSGVYKDTGIVSAEKLNPRGEYNQTETYNRLDAVQYGGSLYIVQKPCIGVTPEDGEYYMLAAARGDNGASINWCGEWDSITSYYKHDAVSFNGYSYICIVEGPHTGYIPDTDGGWGVLAERGSPGDDGKSAYEYAVEGGYTGSEAEFMSMLAQDFPASVTAEAKRVAQNVQSVRTGKSITFAVCSDVHLSLSDAGKGGDTLYAATLKSLKMAGHGVQAIRKLMPLDAAVILGDYTWSDTSYTVQKCKDDFAECIRNFSEALNGIPSAWLVGNHDINYGASRDRTMTEDEVYSYIGANSTGVICDPDYPEKNYYYRDFDGQHIRMIFLNTVDALTEYMPVDGTAAKSEWMSAVQLQWLASTALDFSKKEDASSWGIVICSHHPVNYGDAMKRACMLLEAYKAGTSGNLSYTDGNGVSQNIAYDFTTGEKAEIICNIHGHSHNFGYKKISSSDSVAPWLWRVCVPCINCGRENEQATNADLAEKYGEFDADGNPVYYRKAEWSDEISGWVYNEEKGTSFCVITIDRKSKKIYAHCFGAGYDRTIGYAEEESGSGEEPDVPTYTNLVPTSEALDSTDVYNGGLGYRDGYYISSSSGGDSAKTGHSTTGMIAYPNVSGGQTPPTIYIKGGTADRIGMYYSDKTFKATLTASSTTIYDVEQLDTNYYRLTPVMLTDGTNNSKMYSTYGNICYLRFDVICTTGADIIITLDEPIE